MLDQCIAILAHDQIPVHRALLFSQLSNTVTLFLHEALGPTEHELEQPTALRVRLERGRVERLITEGPRVDAGQLGGVRILGADAVVLSPHFNARAKLFETLGGSGQSAPSAAQIPADTRGMTPVAGAWTVGDAGQRRAAHGDGGRLRTTIG